MMRDNYTTLTCLLNAESECKQDADGNTQRFGTSLAGSAVWGITAWRPPHQFMSQSTISSAQNARIRSIDRSSMEAWGLALAGGDQVMVLMRSPQRGLFVGCSPIS